MSYLKKGTKCLICKNENIKNPAVIFLPAYRLPLCKEHFINWLENRVKKTIEEFKMFGKYDKILVAVSGGKDSLSLWYILNKLGYNADGLHINLGIEKYSNDSNSLVLKFSEKIKRKVFIIEVEKVFDRIENISKVSKRPLCSICGTIKRYYINKYAKEFGYNVVATAHNLDDEVAFLFGNTLEWNLNYLSRQYPVLEGGNGFVKKVKPYCKITEKESALYAFFNKIEYIKYECPFSINSTSIKYKKFFSQIEEEFPGAKIRFYNNFIKKIYNKLKDESSKEILRTCIKCGEPTINEICTICVLKEKYFCKNLK